MKLVNAKRGKTYKIESISETTPDVLSMLQQQGLIPGEEVRFIQSAPLFKDPLLIEVHGCQMAISRHISDSIELSDEES